MEKTCRLVHITYRENNRGPGREEYKYKKPFGPAPPRIQCTMLRMQKYLFHVIWRKGKDQVIANTLSGAPQLFTEPNNVEKYEVHSVRNLPISTDCITDFCEETIRT